MEKVGLRCSASTGLLRLSNCTVLGKFRLAFKSTCKSSSAAVPRLGFEPATSVLWPLFQREKLEKKSWESCWSQWEGKKQPIRHLKRCIHVFQLDLQNRSKICRSFIKVFLQRWFCCCCSNSCCCWRCTCCWLSCCCCCCCWLSCCCCCCCLCFSCWCCCCSRSCCSCCCCCSSCRSCYCSSCRCRCRCANCCSC